MKIFFAALCCLLVCDFSSLAAEDVKVDLPNATGEGAEAINDSRASINSFSCAEIAKDWKDADTVTKYLKIGHSRGKKFLTWMEKAPQGLRVKVAMNMAGFWNLSSPGQAVNSDFYLGRVSGSVSSFMYDTYLKDKRPDVPPKNVLEYLKNEKAKVAKLKDRLFADYQCSKLD